ncbi:MAG: LysR substrate-binding domain-containing protein, partial [Acinetobacter sp.]
KHHVLAKQKSVTWLELCSCPFVTLQTPSIIRHVIEEHCAALQVVLDLKVECHQISSLSHFVAYGMGVSAIPRHFQKFIDLEKNVLVEIEDNQAQLAVGIIYKKDYELSNMSSQFIETTLWHHF